MAMKAPVFPIPSPHYSDYGFDSHFDHFQDTRRHKRAVPEMRSPDAIRFTLRKPISKDGTGKKRSKWWKAALHFWKRDGGNNASMGGVYSNGTPVYMVASGSGGSTPCRSYGRTGMAYMSIRDVGIADEEAGAGAPATMPVYLVT